MIILKFQFLVDIFFSKKDIGKPKPDVDKNSVKLMNPDFKIESMQDIVVPEIENIFNILKLK
jgi:molybdopterin/thiamine biosynthesis adenylyltransferase